LSLVEKHHRSQKAIMIRPKKSKLELEEIAVKRVRARPGCRGVSTITLTLDDDGEWGFELSNPGSADPETAQSAIIAVGDAMHDEFDLSTDT
jgi:hypothetical protein